MGNATSNHASHIKGNLFEQLRSYEKITHQRKQGIKENELNFYKHRQDHKIHAINRIHFITESSQQAVFQKEISKRQHMKSNNICDILGINEDIDNCCGCTSSYQAQVMVQTSDRSLLDECQDRASHINKAYFSTNELFIILCEQISALNHYSTEHKIHHKNIRIDHMYICSKQDFGYDSNTHYNSNLQYFTKLIDPIVFYPDSNITLGITQQLQDMRYIYPSPQVMQALEHKDFKTSVHIEKSDLFSIGMCILHCALLEDLSDCYDHYTHQYFPQVLQRKLHQLQDMSIYSPQFVRTLEQILQYDEHKRPEPGEFLHSLFNQISDIFALPTDHRTHDRPYYMNKDRQQSHQNFQNLPTNDPSLNQIETVKHGGRGGQHKLNSANYGNDVQQRSAQHTPRNSNNNHHHHNNNNHYQNNYNNNNYNQYDNHQYHNHSNHNHNNNNYLNPQTDLIDLPRMSGKGRVYQIGGHTYEIDERRTEVRYGDAAEPFQNYNQNHNILDGIDNNHDHRYHGQQQHYNHQNQHSLSHNHSQSNLYQQQQHHQQQFNLDTSGMKHYKHSDKKFNLNISQIEKLNHFQKEISQNNNNQEIYNQDGSRYKGQLANQRRHGFGIFYYPTGGRYEGYFQNDQQQGNGQLYGLNDNLIYIGEFQNGQFNGFGQLYNDQPFGNQNQLNYRDLRDDGLWTKYEGFFQNDYREGEGTLHFKGGAVYQGYFQNDVPNGVGVFKQQNKPDLNGVWENGQFVQELK